MDFKLTASTLSVDNLKSAFTLTSLLSLAGVWLGYRILVALYNISPFHPLSRFPGPKIAAASYAYEAYHDWIRGGRYGPLIREMHERYGKTTSFKEERRKNIRLHRFPTGPIVRINPDELHCSDPYFTDEIYAGPGRIRDKWQHQLNTGGAGPVSVAGFSTVAHELHRSRKGALAKFFSRQQMFKLEGEVLDFAHLTVDKLLRFAGREPFDIKEAFNCFTADVISQYAFGKSMGFIEQEDWLPNFASWTSSFMNSAYTMRHNALGRKLTNLLPLFANYMGEDIKAVMHQMGVVIPGYIQASLDDPDGGRLFAELVKSKTLPPEEMTMYRLSGEGFSFLLAGTETTATTLSIITFWLLEQPDTYRKLMDDLEGLTPTNIKWAELEQRPYLWAIVHEALRMMPGVAHRSARIARTEDLVYRSQDGKTEWVIPRGTPIGMTSMINHYNEELFPNPHAFLPERWLIDGKPNHKLQKFLLSFSKGSRMCIGESLAYCEVYLMAALIAMRVIPRARLVNTTYEENLKYDHDCIVPHSKNGPASVHVQIV
ncbi:putative cytochrome P450 E-class, group IV [Triangularia verruculosa]|uniref:Cytochrome P450 E-class, group IV n=1 Tax=Triangularia verruculosa TaxID=2587418 RepID=A0AAN6XBZ4_9PEZI|nr:putative cytochrome P450 E-class, group IV [Triangularia verruculosa]